MYRNLISGILLASGILSIIIAFQPCDADTHYLFRSVGESLILAFAVVIVNGKAYLQSIALFGFLLSLNNLYDEVFGNPLQFTLVELIFGILSLILLYNLIKKQWKHHQK